MVDRQLVFVRLPVAVYQRTGHLDVKVRADRRDEPALGAIEQRGVGNGTWVDLFVDKQSVSSLVAALAIPR